MAATIIPSTEIPRGSGSPAPGGPSRPRADAKPGSRAWLRKRERSKERYKLERTCIEETCRKAFIGGPSARWCPKCRARFLGHAKKYHWTPEMDEILRNHYAVEGQYRTAERLHIHPRAVYERASVLGLTRGADPKRWTPEEESLLEEWAGTYTIRTIARRLSRKPVSVSLKLRRMQISGAVRGGNTAASLAECFGVSDMTVASWIRRGLFGKVERLDVAREHAPFEVTDAQVLAFVRNNPTVFRLARVDQTWFLDLVFNSRASGNGKKP